MSIELIVAKNTMDKAGIYTGCLVNNLPIIVTVIEDNSVSDTLKLKNMDTNLEFEGLRTFFAPLPIDSAFVLYSILSEPRHSPVKIARSAASSSEIITAETGLNVVIVDD